MIRERIGEMLGWIYTERHRGVTPRVMIGWIYADGDNLGISVGSPT